MTRRNAALIALMLGATSSGVAGQSVDGLSVRVTIERPHGGFVNNLTAADFRVRVDGVDVAVRSARADAPPLSLAFVIDVTASGRIQFLGTRPGEILGRDAAGLESGFSKGLRPVLVSRDRLALGYFGPRLSWLVPGTSVEDYDQVLAAVRRILTSDSPDFYGPSPIWDVTAEAVDALRGQGRRSVVLITDGEASGNRLSMSDAALRACAADVAVSAVFMPAQTGFGGLSSGGGLLRKLVADTGGIFRANESLTAAGWRERDHLAPLGPIVDGLRTSYLLDLALEPEALEAGSVRRLDVSTRDPALMIHAPALVCR